MQYLQNQGIRSHSLLPDGFSHLFVLRSGLLGIQYGMREEHSSGPVFAFSQLSRRISLRFYGDSIVYGIVFKPLGMRQLLDIDVSACNDLLIDDASLFTKYEPLFAPIMEGAADPGLAAFAEHCNRYFDLCRPLCTEQPQWLHAIVNTLPNSGWLYPAEEFYRQAPVSPRRFQSIFRDHTGSTLKTYLRILRFNNFVTRCKHDSTILSLAEYAGQCGYLDQAHLSHEVNAITGKTPSSYLRSRLLVYGIE
ncbi:MAG: helix-turn-helix domain-containing protein [Spirochaetes bacterium]|nr:helix-turn-helix domain-containing protein [Spirochaetota bacterium]